MNIREYYYSLNKEERRKAKILWAEELGVHTSTVEQYISGFRKPKMDKIKKLEKLTNGKIKREDVRPDFYK